MTYYTIKRKLGFVLVAVMLTGLLYGCALSEHDQSKYGKVTVIKEVNHFWDEAMRLLCLED